MCTVATKKKKKNLTPTLILNIMTRREDGVWNGVKGTKIYIGLPTFSFNKHSVRTPFIFLPNRPNGYKKKRMGEQRDNTFTKMYAW